MLGPLLQSQEETLNTVNFALKQLAALSPFIKHPGFYEEQEWRLVNREAIHGEGQKHSKEMNWRPKGSLLIPYLAPKLDEIFDAFDVIVGPMANQSEARMSVESFLRKELNRDVDVTTSGIPFRLI